MRGRVCDVKLPPMSISPELRVPPWSPDSRATASVFWAWRLYGERLLVLVFRRSPHARNSRGHGGHEVFDVASSESAQSRASFVRRRHAGRAAASTNRNPFGCELNNGAFVLESSIGLILVRRWCERVQIGRRDRSREACPNPAAS